MSGSNFVKLSVAQDLIVCSGKQIPFHLVAKEHVPIPNTESEAEYVYRRYRPFPDVALYKNGFPYFFCELDSLSNRADKYRMCVQMACALRFGHYLRGVSGTRETTTLFLMGAFVNRDWVVNRYFACFDHDGKTVCLKPSSLRSAWPLIHMPRLSLSTKILTCGKDTTVRSLFPSFTTSQSTSRLMNH